MSNEKIIAVVGVSEELTAHMRLLLRRAMPVLGQAWKWGLEDIADLIVINPRDLAGQMARTRAQASGVRCAVVLHDGMPDEPGFTLRVPFKLESFVEVMRGAARPSVTSDAQIGHADEDFYYRSNDAPPGQQTGAGDFWTRARARAEATAAETVSDQHQAYLSRDSGIALGLDEMLKANPAALKVAPKPVVTLDDHVTIQAAPSGGARADKRQGDSVRGILGETFSDDELLRFAKDEVDPGHATLRGILDGSEVAAPSQLQTDELPALIVDPKNRLVYAEAPLSALAPYCQQSIPLKSLRVLTSRDLNEVRTRATAYPYNDVIWLDQIMKGTGHLGRKFDPAGTFRIKRPVTAERDFRSHGRIVDIMLGPARRLNEIAQEAGASMDDVFNLVNAYDTIGELEWFPKQRQPLPGSNANADKSLLGKIKWPFGKKS